MSSVPKSKHAQSKKEFDNCYYKVYDDCFLLCVHNFGWDRKKYIQTYRPRIPSDTKETDPSYPDYIAKQEKFDKQLEGLDIMMAQKRKECARLAEEILYHLKVANSIFPTCRAEINERRIEQDKAIGCCQTLLTQYKIVTRKFKISANKYVEATDNLKHEINVIKKWRESDNTFRKKYGEDDKSVLTQILVVLRDIAGKEGGE